MQIFNRTTMDMSITKAREMSKDQRSERLLGNNQFNYGEIVKVLIIQNFRTIYQIFQRIKKLRKMK